MARSIAEAQAKFLSEGGPVGGLTRPKPNELSPIETMLAEYISKFLDTAADNLNSTNSVTTGNLLDSLDFQLESNRNGYVISFTALDYWKFVDKGVRGAGESKKNKTSPYKFKYITPSKSHVDAILSWMKINNIVAKAMDVQKYGKTRRESKSGNPQDEKRSVAKVIARSIKKQGLEATNFWSNAIDSTFKDFGVRLSEALGRTITVNIRQMKEDLQGKGVKIPT